MFFETSETSSESYYYNMGLNFKLGQKEPEEINMYFIRGLFETSGTISNRENDNSTLFCTIDLLHPQLQKFFSKSLKIIDILFTEENIFKNKIIFSHDALDFLSKIYDNSDKTCRDENKYNTYVKWATLGLFNKIPNCKFVKADKDAVSPKKERSSDVGYDLTIIKKYKNITSKTILYDTGIAVTPDFGYYTKIVPRSSLIKSGYMLTNSVGIIDGSYKGNLLICLTKIDDELPDLKLPFRCCQLIIDRSMHYTMEKVNTVEDLGKSSRGDGGFGSTDKK